LSGKRKHVDKKIGSQMYIFIYLLKTQITACQYPPPAQPSLQPAPVSVFCLRVLPSVCLSGCVLSAACLYVPCTRSVHLPINVCASMHAVFRSDVCMPCLAVCLPGGRICMPCLADLTDFMLQCLSGFHFVCCLSCSLPPCMPL
jgi:hypothetical protein